MNPRPAIFFSFTILYYFADIVSIFFFGALFSLPNIQRVKKGAKVVLKDVIFANCILTDLSFPLRWPGASLSDGGHFNLPRCEVAVRTTLSASLDY